MNGHLSKIALVSCMILLLVACNQIDTSALTDETTPSAVATPLGVNGQTESESPLPTQVSTTMVESTESQQEAVVSISPTKAITEGHIMNEPQEQFLPGDGSAENIELARQDLAKRLGVSVESITVTAVIGQEFSTDAFYCHVTKERIAKNESLAVISGLSILLSASGRRYEYHASGETVIFCQPLP